MQSSDTKHGLPFIMTKDPRDMLTRACSCEKYCDLKVDLDTGRSVYNFFAIYIHSNEIHNVAALIVY